MQIHNDNLKIATTAPSSQAEQTCALVDSISATEPGVVSISCAAGASLVEEYDEIDAIYVLRSGWAMESTLLPDGRCQVQNILLPGDVVGLGNLVSGLASHSVVAITDLSVVKIPVNRIDRMRATSPDFQTLLTRRSAQEHALLRARLVSVGRRSAVERMAHFILELRIRLRERGLTEDLRMPWMVTQEIIADALGLSIVHVNRTLRKLRERKLIDFPTVREIRVLDEDGLCELAEFDACYLLPEGPSASMVH